jgi:hypothetical protein
MISQDAATDGEGQPNHDFLMAPFLLDIIVVTIEEWNLVGFRNVLPKTRCIPKKDAEIEKGHHQSNANGGVMELGGSLKELHGNQAEFFEALEHEFVRPIAGGSQLWRGQPSPSSEVCGDKSSPETEQDNVPDDGRFNRILPFLKLIATSPLLFSTSFKAPLPVRL